MTSTPQKWNRDTTAGVVALLALLALIVWGVLSLTGAFHRETAAAPALSGLAAANPYTLRALCERVAEGQLKAPKSAKFVLGDSLPVFKAPAWIWDGQVDAQNALGVPLRQSFTCTVTGADAATASAAVTFRR